MLLSGGRDKLYYSKYNINICNKSKYPNYKTKITEKNNIGKERYQSRCLNTDTEGALLTSDSRLFQR